MRTPRFTIAKLMGTVASSAILLAVFRLGSFAGLVALLPFGITAIIARLSGGPSAYRQALWVGVRRSDPDNLDSGIRSESLLIWSIFMLMIIGFHRASRRTAYLEFRDRGIVCGPTF